MILFLNKADVFSVKIRDPQQQIQATFPDYQGRPGNYQDGVHYFKQRFQALSRGQKEVYVHVTTAVGLFRFWIDTGLMGRLIQRI